MRKIIKPHEQKSALKEYLDRQTSIRNISSDLFAISFYHFDNTQGATFVDWENDSKLSQALGVLQGYCKRKLREQLTGDKFVEYGSFPAKSDFHPPPYVPPDAKWARIHIDGKHVVAGHIVNNIFYIVFLDSNHRFFIQEN